MQKCKFKERRIRCIRCNQLFTKDKITFAPDPFAEEIKSDDTSVWECKKCRFDSKMDI